MLTLNEALEAARARLEQAFASEPWTIVLKPELTQEHELAWIVRYDTQESIDAGDPMVGPFNKLVIVPKDGSRVDFPRRTCPSTNTWPTSATAAGSGRAWRRPRRPSRGRPRWSGCCPRTTGSSSW